MSENTLPSSITPEYNIADFEYELPSELIALEPLNKRESSKLMCINRATSEIKHQVFSDIRRFLKAGDVLVLNDTRVIPAKLTGTRATGGKVELLLIKLVCADQGHWQAMANPLRKLKEGEILKIICTEREFGVKVVGFCETEDGQRRVVVELGSGNSVFEVLSSVGNAPLPPYITRNGHNQETRAQDLERYQTVFAKAPGAVAAPTAGLHFSPELLTALQSDGVETCFVTLHVGPGTFKPVTTSVEAHAVESETFFVPAETVEVVNKAKKAGRRIIAVGTTSCRTLETAGASGILHAVNQGSTSLYIRPGHQFRMVDALITNFHLSKSSLLILVSAFAGRDLIMNAYQTAVEHQYRFYSYGDAMFIE